MKKILVVFLFLFLPCLALAAVDKIVFITEPQNTALSVVSGPITIQSQNSSGAEEKITETFDLEFISSSPSGEFLNSSGGAATKYMSRNTANRSFYYRDNNVGEYDLTVNATGRDSGQKFSASQKIIIGTTNNNQSSSSTSNTSSNNSNSVSGTGVPVVSSGLSSHSAQSDLSDEEESLPSIGAGRLRLVTVGSPIIFHPVKNKNASMTNNFTWSFGDGESAVGEKVSHVYKAAGDYNIILNADSPSGKVVTRTKVKVENPQIKIVAVDKNSNVIKLKNNNRFETNVGSWSISGSSAYQLAEDTILDTGIETAISLPAGFLNTATTGIALISPDGRTIATWGDLPSGSDSKNLTKLEGQLLDLKKQLSVIKKDREVAVENNFEREYSIPENISNINTPSRKIVLTPKSNWWQKILGLVKK